MAEIVVAMLHFASSVRTHCWCSLAKWPERKAKDNEVIVNGPMFMVFIDINLSRRAYDSFALNWPIERVKIHLNSIHNRINRLEMVEDNSIKNLAHQATYYSYEICSNIQPEDRQRGNDTVTSFVDHQIYTYLYARYSLRGICASNELHLSYFPLNLVNYSNIRCTHTHKWENSYGFNEMGAWIVPCSVS